MRTEFWTHVDAEGFTATASIDVRDDNTVVVAFPFLANMLERLGFKRDEVIDGS